MEAVALLQEWVRDIGAVAGLTPANTSIYSGAIGVPESKLQLEVTLDTLADLEQFWASIPPTEHKAWSQRMQSLVVHGSPTWEVYRTVAAFPATPSSPTLAPPTLPASSSTSVANTGLVMASGDDLERYGETSSPASSPSIPSTVETSPSGLSVVSSSEDADVILDWKGEPLKINPGDKLPFKFR
jgi:hypothetical protein